MTERQRFGLSIFKMVLLLIGLVVFAWERGWERGWDDYRAVCNGGGE